MPKKKPLPSLNKLRKLEKMLRTDDTGVEHVPINFKPFEYQKRATEVLENGKTRYFAFVGGIRAGKTQWGAYEALRQSYLFPRSSNIGWIVSPNYKMSLVAKRAFEQLAGELIMTRLKAENVYLLWPTDPQKEPFRVEVKSSYDPDELRGAGVSWIWMDEGAYCPENTWQVLMGRVLDTRGVIFVTTTPKGMNWVYRDIYVRWQQGDPEYGMVKARTIENPTLDAQDVARMYERYGEQEARQELDAEFVSYSGLVYKEFSDRHIVAPFQIAPGTRIVCGIDFGYSDPTVCLWLAEVGGVWYVVDEYYEPRRSLQEHALAILNHPLARFVSRYYADPSAAQERQEFTKFGLYTVSANNNRTAGHSEVNRLLYQKSQQDGGPLLRVFSTCVKTISEFRQYSFRETSDGRNIGELTVRGFDHAMDALRYAIMGVSTLRAVHVPKLPEGDLEMSVDPESRWYALP